MDMAIICILIISIASLNSWVVNGKDTLDVIQYGAKGDGGSDDSQAFMDAFKALCDGNHGNTLVVPEGYSFFVRPILNFTGPCHSKNINIKIMGTILAPQRNDWGRECSIFWIHFFNISGLTLEGSGVINGNGKGWWDRGLDDFGVRSNRKMPHGQRPSSSYLFIAYRTSSIIVPVHITDDLSTHESLRNDTPKPLIIHDESKSNVKGTGNCPRIPTALQFDKCDGLQISGLTHINGPGPHIAVTDSNDVTISHIHIHSPNGSHNTDGVDLTRDIRVNIHDTSIESGDDCIAVKGGTKFVNISKITCGPNVHGISVGSLGGHGSEEYVENLIVKNCTFNGAASAVKIKTWPGGKGYVKNILFKDIIINHTNFPVYIDQHYMRTPEQKQAIKIRNITFSNIYGTCVGEDAVVLDCAKIGCDNITLNQINITSINPKKPASAKCNHVRGKSTNIISPSGKCVTN